ncbi:MFS transporter [Sporomusa acidovorans]|uniref:MFS transporter n=1 Tax=Sporomusa acidovorans TaxID=112900 RepID=UPI00088D604E|nr:MFS transporter [Sporomusa acidovorans]OZC14788.1 putative sulfoacetate transporter SauU [Sporomusa acidovorans DSM 3132]SDF71090.1 Sugar phosphate permease [Sporomusa acidovorans]
MLKRLDMDLIKQMQRYRQWIFLVISMDYVLAYFHKGVSAVVGPEIIKELALLPTSLGVISSAYFWSFAAMALPAGMLSDTWGARKTLGVFIFLAGLGGFIFANTYNIELLAIGRLVIGFGSGALYVAAMRFVADWYKPDEMATCSGILLAAGNIGALLATTPLVFLMGNIGWRGSFILVAVLTLLASIVSYKFVRNKPADLEFPSPQEIMGISTVSQKVKISLAEAVKVVLGKKKFYLLAAFTFSYYGTFMGFGSLWAGPYLQNIYHFSKASVGNILMLFPLGMIIGCPLSGYLSDKVFKSRKQVLIYGCVLHTLSYIPFIFFTEQMTSLSLYILFFFYGLTGGAFVSCFACAKEIYEDRFAGTANGALVIFVSLGAAFYQYVMALVINMYSMISPGVYSLAAYKSAFIVPVCGLLLGVIALIFFKEEPSKCNQIE